MHDFANCRKFKSPVTLTLDRVKVISACTIPVELPACPTIWLWCHALPNMAIWISWNFNCHDSFLRRKFEKSGSDKLYTRSHTITTNHQFWVSRESGGGNRARNVQLLATVENAPWPWPWIGSRSHHFTQYVENHQLAQPYDCSTMHYRNMAVWISWNIDIWRSLNSCDGFPRRKFKNWALISCSPGHILSPSTVTFELHAKTAEEIDLEKSNFCNFGSSVTLTLTLDRVEVTLVRICCRGLPTYQVRWKLEKLFVDVRTDRRTDGYTWVPIY